MIAALFYIENSSPEELETEIDEIIELLHEENKEEIALFSNWFNNYLAFIAFIEAALNIIRYLSENYGANEKVVRIIEDKIKAN